MEKVILVDPQDNAIGTMEKMEAHKKGLLHRAFSVVIFNSKGEMLIQKRAHTKYHSAGLWTNACCSHPMPGEAIEDATRRRLLFEMGIDLSTHFAFKFTYKVSLDHGLIEHEVDHVFTAVFDGSPSVNPDEVADWKFVDLSSLKTDVRQNPQHYTYWFSLILDHSMLKQKI
jgi:isopentenyl-diphosphate delta-isomerase